MYELIFEGTEDTSPETLRRVKGAFISDLNFSVEEVKNILENAPLMILRAPNESELTSLFSTLKKAGGKVAIVKPAESENDGSTQEEGFEFTIDFDEENEQTTILSPSEPEKDPPVYALDFNPDEDLPESLDPASNEELAQSSELTEASDVSEQPVVAAETPTLPEENNNQESDALEFNLSEDKVDIQQENLPVDQAEHSEPAAEHLEDDGGALEFAIDLEQPQSQSKIESSASAPSQQLSPEPKEEIEDNETGLSFVVEEESPQQDLPEATQAKGEKTATKIQEDEGIDEQLVDSAVDQAFSPEISLESEEEVEQEEQTVVNQVAPEKIKTEKDLEVFQPSNSISSKKKEKNKKDKQPEPKESPDDQYDLNGDTVEFDHTSAKMQQPRNFSSLGILGLVVVVLLIGGNSFLLYENIFVKQQASGIQEETIESIISSLASQPEPAKTSSSKPDNSSLSFSDLRGSYEHESVKINWDLTTRGDQVISGNLQLSTARPPALTPEEIVRGTEPHPWLRRAELLALRFVPTDGGRFRATTLARSYIEQGANRHRAVAKAEVIARYDSKADLLTGEVSLFLDFEPSELTQVFEIKSPNPGLFQFGLQAPFSNRDIVENIESDPANQIPESP